MKKNGFTLAEVLITLTIIGVIATMTLPALLTNTQEQQAITGLKKGISTLTDISQMNQAIDGYDYAGLVAPAKIKLKDIDPTADDDVEIDGLGSTDTATKTLFSVLASRGSVDLKTSTNQVPAGILNSLPSVGNGGVPNTIVYFRDGSAVLYNGEATAVTDDNGMTRDDGLAYGFTVVFDTNGAKGPNILSNCQGSATGTTADTNPNIGNNAETDDETASKCTNQNRVIKDRFLVQLRAGHAVPYGAAAKWAYSK